MKPLSISHFPFIGNETILGAGDRRDCISGSLSFSLAKDYKNYFKGQLFLIKSTKLTPSDNSLLVNTTIGKVPINLIERPALDVCNRSASGSQSQLAVVDYLDEVYGFNLISMAQLGSHGPDIVGLIDSFPIQVEVKGLANFGSQISMFDKSVRRGVECSILDRLAQSTLGAPNFESMIDSFIDDSRVHGFAEDPCSPKSGSVPPKLNQELQKHLGAGRDIVLQHLRDSGDTHLGIYSRNSDDVIIYSVYENDPLHLPMLPDLKEFTLATHGGPYKGATRFGVRIKI